MATAFISTLRTRDTFPAALFLSALLVGSLSAAPLRIMPVGDSITAGYTDNPDIILLMIGINDMDSGSPVESATLVDMILTTKPHAHLILAQITPMSSNGTYAQKNADLVAYNTYIRETLVPNLQTLGKRISTINQHRNSLTDPKNPASDINASLYSNGINHPTNPAYDTMADTMADAWFAGIQGVVAGPASPVLSERMFLPSISQGTTIGTFTTTPPPVPESVSYSYATGPGDTDNSKVTISAKLAGGVQQIRFTMLTTNGNAGRAVYRELDVFGTASAIPPTEILNLAPLPPASPGHPSLGGPCLS